MGRDGLPGDRHGVGVHSTMHFSDTIRAIRDGEEDRLAAVLAGALAEDPFVRWIAANDPERATIWMRAGVDLCRRHGLVLVDDALRGGALLIAPGGTPAPLRTNLALLPRMLRAVGARRLPGILRALVRIEGAHPAEPHWSGLVLGVEASARGAGVGRALIAAALERVEADGVGAYLEVADGGPSSLYARYGFAPHGRVAAGAGAPVMATMWRPPA